MAEQHVQIAGVPPTAVAGQAVTTPTQTEVEGQQQGPVDVEKLTAEITAKVMEGVTPLLETQKSQIAGLDAKNTALEKEKAEAAAAAVQTEGTLQQQVEALRTTMETDKHEAAVKEAAATLAAKQLGWKAYAAKLRLPDDLVHVPPDLSDEDGVKHLDALRAAFDDEKNKELTEQLGAGWKPGTGNLTGGEGGTPGYDPNDSNTWTGEETRDQVIAAEQKLFDQRTAANLAQFNAQLQLGQTG